MKYWAFLSYSSADRKLAEWLHQRLERYPLPEGLSEIELSPEIPLGKHLRPVFRDRDELSTSAELGSTLEGALRESRCLIVLCTPSAARSEWVEKEIQYFRSLGRGERIFAVIAEGEPNASQSGGRRSEFECFPPSLRAPHEPLAADLRTLGDGRQRGFLKLLAGVLETDFEALYQRHLRLRKRRRLAAAAALVVALSLLGLGITEISRQKELARLASEGEQAARASEKQQREETQDLRRGLVGEGIESSPLVEAIVSGDLSDLEARLDGGWDVKERIGSFAHTPLMIAALTGNQESLTWLLDQGADYFAYSTKGGTAAHLAAQKNQVGSLEIFAAQGLDLDVRTRNGEQTRPIDIAAIQGFLPMIRRLHSLGANLEGDGKPGLESEEYEEIKNITGPVPDHLKIRTSSLGWAGYFQQTAAVELLLELGVQTHWDGEYMGSPLQAVIESGNQESVEMVLNASLEVPAKEWNLRLRDLLKREGVSFKPRLETVTLTRFMLEQGADPNEPVPISDEPDSYLITLLEMFLRSQEFEVTQSENYFPVVKVLLEGGADPNAAPSFRGDPILHLAIMVNDGSEGDREVVRLLLDHGADPDTPTDFGHSPIWTAMAERYGDLEVVKLLLNRGVKIRFSRDSRGRMRTFDYENELRKIGDPEIDRLLDHRQEN